MNRINNSGSTVASSLLIYFSCFASKVSLLMKCSVNQSSIGYPIEKHNTDPHWSRLFVFAMFDSTTSWGARYMLCLPAGVVPAALLWIC